MINTNVILKEYSICNTFLERKLHHHYSLVCIYLYTNSVALVRKSSLPIERLPHVGKVSAKFADRGSRVASAMDPHGR
jgi:hypothetical protein